MFKIFFVLLSFSFLYLNAYAASTGEIKPVDTVVRPALMGKFDVRPFEREKDGKGLLSICMAHAASPMKDMLSITFADLLEAHRATQVIRDLGEFYHICGLHGLYYQVDDKSQETIVGFILVNPMKTRHPTGYAEFFIVMNPAQRERGFGSQFLRMFNTKMVGPRIGQKYDVLVTEDNKMVREPRPLQFYGVKGLIDIANMPSRRMVKNAGYTPYDLCYDTYQKGELRPQTIYVYPSYEESLLPIELQRRILENKEEDLEEIATATLLRQKEHDYRRKIINDSIAEWEKVKTDSKRIRKLYEFMKALSTTYGKTFPEKEFDHFIRARALMGQCNKADYEEKLKLRARNSADFPSKTPTAGLDDKTIALMASTEFSIDTRDSFFSTGSSTAAHGGAGR